MKQVRSLRDELKKSFLKVGVIHAMGIPLSLIVSAVLARSLGPQQFGQYTFVLSILSLMALPVVSGLAPLLTRETAIYTQTGRWRLFRGIYQAANYWVFAISTGLILLFFLASHFARYWASEAIWAILSIAIFLIPINGISAVRKGAMKGLGYPALSELITKIIQPLLLLLGIGVLLAQWQLTAVNALKLQVVVGVLAAIFGSVLLSKIQSNEAKMSHPGYQAKVWLLALVPFMLIHLGSILTSQISILLLGILGSDESVAALRVGEKGAHFVSLSLVLVNMVISPHIVRTYREGDTKQLEALAQGAARRAFLLAIPVGLILFVYGKALISLVYGDVYAEISYVPMVVMLIGQLFHVALGSVSLLLAMSGREMIVLAGHAAGLTTSVVLGTLLIPECQAIGAAIAATSGLIIWKSALAYAVFKCLKIRSGVF